MKIFQVLKTFLISFSELITYCPTLIGFILRYLRFRLLNGKAKGIPRLAYGVEIIGCGNITLGSNFQISRLATIAANNGGKIVIGNNTAINEKTFIGASDKGYIEIGNDVTIAYNVSIRASDHIFVDKNAPIKEQGHIEGKIIIEDNVWIAANCIITKDVIIGKNSVIAAGAVVTGDVEPNAIYGGIPARKIKNI
jgi:galactoside O-acetyltransferase